MNWEFLLGLLLPAFGAGYIWLIKTAREDPVLYREIDAQLRVLLPILLLALFVTVIIVAVAKDESGSMPKKEMTSLLVVLSMLLSLMFQALPFFRRIAALPAKNTPPKRSTDDMETSPKKESHTPE